MRPLPIANPANPWESHAVEYLEEPPRVRLEIFEDHTREILSHNDSADTPFRWSINPYRGCVHACCYCYARPTHEYLGFGAGTDFDRKIVVKPQAKELLRDAFERSSWRGETIVFSGNTDCYQPLEASYRLTRGCLEVCALYRNPVGIITKSPLIERDIDVLVELHQHSRLRVCISIAFWDEARARALEPYVATPARRMKIIERLARAGLDVTVMVAPLIPGLNDEEMVSVLENAAMAGAKRAYGGLLHLPGSAKDVFFSRLRQAFPLRAEKVLNRMMEARQGNLNENRPGVRHTGKGEYSQTMLKLFDMHARKFGLGSEGTKGSVPKESAFRRPTDRGGQLRLFPNS